MGNHSAQKHPPVVWVIGATSGIGKSLAEKFAEDSYNVIASGRRLELLNQLKEKYPEQTTIFEQDVNDFFQNELRLSQILEKYPQVDLVVHCAGIGEENPALDWETEQKTLQTNVLAAAHLYGLVFKHFKKQGFGHLAAISSIASLRGNRHAPAYFASKAFQVNYLESLYLKTKEIKPGKIYITDIRPGFVDTKMALGNEIFWLVPLPKAARQIYKAIRQKKRKVYISHRWALIAVVLKTVPSSWIKFFK